MKYPYKLYINKYTQLHAKTKQGLLHLYYQLVGKNRIQPIENIESKIQPKPVKMVDCIKI